MIPAGSARREHTRPKPSPHLRRHGPPPRRRAGRAGWPASYSSKVTGNAGTETTAGGKISGRFLRIRAGRLGREHGLAAGGELTTFAPVVRAPVSGAYADRQIVGIDLHRRRSVLVRMTESGERLETVRISNDPEYLAEQVKERSTTGTGDLTGPRSYRDDQQLDAELTAAGCHPIADPPGGVLAWQRTAAGTGQRGDGRPGQRHR